MPVVPVQRVEAALLGAKDCIQRHLILVDELTTRTHKEDGRVSGYAVAAGTVAREVARPDLIRIKEVHAVSRGEGLLLGYPRFMRVVYEGQVAAERPLEVG